MKKKYKIDLWILCGSLLYFSACEKILLNNPGEQVKVNKSISLFKEIAIYDIFDIELKSDSIYSLLLYGNADYLDNISFTNDSGILIIHDNNKYKWLADYPRTKIVIGFPKIDKILLEVPSHLFSLDTLKLQKLELISLGKTAEINLIVDVTELRLWTGSLDFGYYELKGKAKSSLIWHQGNSIVDAIDLESGKCEIYNFSVGDCFINVSKKLTVHLFSLGNIFFRGNPDEIIIAEQKNKGELIRLPD